MSPVPYVELHCKTNFSFLRAASHPQELVARAAQLGYAGLAITDHHSLAGVVRAHTATQDHPLKLLIGAEIHPRDASPLVLWAMNRAGYGRLSRLLTCGRRRAPKGESQLTWEDVAQHAGDLLAGILDPHDKRLMRYRELFGDRCYLLGHLHRGADDPARLAGWQQRSRATGIPLVAAGDVRYHSPARMPFYDALTAVRHGVTVAEAERYLLPNAQWHLRAWEDLRRVWSAAPEALQRTCEVADRCHFSLSELRYEYPEELAPPGQTPLQFLRQLTWQGAHWRYPQEVPGSVCRLLEHELALIEELHYEAYLTVYDLVQFARSRQILCQGRGSAANSAVCYCLGITAVDPHQSDVLFERFVSRERDEAPDIDVDFEHERREEVLQYIYQKYGRQRAGMTAEVITYRSRSAIRDIGKALGLSLDRVDALAKNADGYRDQPGLDGRCREVGIDPQSEVGCRLIRLVEQLIGFPRHLSQHVGGMVITQGPLCELVPIENAAMEGRTVIQWNKDDLDDLGILKVDCLALGMLTAIRKSFQLIERHAGQAWKLATIPQEDPDVYDMICRADTMGVFQIESRAQMSMLPRLRPRCYYDLVIEVAIVRPGPIQGQMVHPYLRRRAGLEQVHYPNEQIRQVLDKTLGVPIFQEQAMRLAVVAAGFTPGEADQLRRAMGAWRRPGIIDRFRQKLIEGMRQRGLSEEFAQRVFLQIRGFGEYGFPESHAASFAKLVYVSAWIKYHYPAVFTAALLNSQPMGFYAPGQLIGDARQHDVPVRPIDVNFSDWDCTLEPIDPPHGDLSPDASRRGSPWALRLGLRLISGLPREAASRIAQARQQRRFESLDDFTRRSGLGRAVIGRLSEADAFPSLDLNRRHALWESLLQPARQESRPLLDGLLDEEPDIGLPALTAQEEVIADYRASGFSLRAHPLSFYRQQLDQLRITPAKGLLRVPNNRRVCVAGLVLLRQRPSTARGITFVTLEDETGTANLVIRQTIWERFRRVARHSPAWLAHGRLECKESVIHVVTDRIEDLSDRLGAIKTKSRDFQ